MLIRPATTWKDERSPLMAERYRRRHDHLIEFELIVEHMHDSLLLRMNSLRSLAYTEQFHWIMSPGIPTNTHAHHAYWKSHSAVAMHYPQCDNVRLILANDWAPNQI